MIEIKSLNKKALFKLIHSMDFLELPFLPISRHRGLSHYLNPRADDNDTLLLLAYDNQELVGYLGVLADWIYEDQIKHKCGWLSCMWIDEKCRGKGISKKLVAHALIAWEKKILVTEFTYPAKRLYDKTEAFKDLRVTEGLRLYVRSDLAKLLPPKSNNLSRLKPLWILLDAGINLLLDWRLSFTDKNKSLQWEYINHVTDEVDQFIRSKQQDQVFRRTKIELQWMLDHPWILSAPEKDLTADKYYFSSVAKDFRFTCVCLRDENHHLIAFLIFAIRDHTLKIPYCYYLQNKIEKVRNCVIWHIKKWKVKTCTVVNPSLVANLKENKTPALFQRSVKKHYIISKVFESFDSSKNFSIQDGDADCAFT